MQSRKSAVNYKYNKSLHIATPMFCLLFIANWDTCDTDILNITTPKVKYSFIQKTPRAKSI